jgi:hypothetical protein
MAFLRGEDMIEPAVDQETIRELIDEAVALGWTPRGKPEKRIAYVAEEMSKRIAQICCLLNPDDPNSMQFKVCDIIEAILMAKLDGRMIDIGGLLSGRLRSN